MKLYATTTSERASKGQGGNDYLDIVITGAYQTELITLNIKPDGAQYRLTGWTHDNHRIDIKINENMGERPYQKICRHRWFKPYINEAEQLCAECGLSDKGNKKKDEKLFCPYCGNKTQTRIDTGDDNMGGQYRHCLNCKQNF